MARAEPRELFAALRETERAHRDMLRIHRWSLMDADLTFGLPKRLAAAWIGREHGGGIAARLVADVPNKTLEVDAALREAARQGDSISALDVFLATYGHRFFSLDIAAPTFAEQPEQLERLIQLTEDGRPQTETRFQSSILGPPPNV